MRTFIGFLAVLALAGVMFFKAADAISIASANLGKNHATPIIAIDSQPP